MALIFRINISHGRPAKSFANLKLTAVRVHVPVKLKWFWKSANICCNYDKRLLAYFLYM